ncbi:MAG: rRNA adenine N-6-methyltransferase family protein [Veillonella sp.]
MAEFKNPDLPIKVVANLPYYITTPILMHLISLKFLSRICGHDAKRGGRPYLSRT